MLIIGILLAVTIGALLINQLSRDFDVGFFSGLVALIFGIALAGAVIAVPLERMTIRGEIAEFQSVAETAERARAAGDEIEGAAFRLKIADMNRWLASTQYYRTTVFQLWIPAEVESLEPIQ